MKRALLTVCLASFLWSTVLFADDKAGELSKFLPSDANTVSVVHMKKILNSPRAKSENWSVKQSQSFLDGHFGLPPWVNTLVIGSLTHPAVPEEVWATSIAEVQEGISFESVAKENELKLIDLAGLNSVQTMSGSYVADIGNNRMVGYRPGHRQDAIAWFQSVEMPQDPPKSYLVKAAGLESDIVMGIDFKNMLDVTVCKDIFRTGSSLYCSTRVDSTSDPIAVNSARCHFTNQHWSNHSQCDPS